MPRSDDDDRSTDPVNSDIDEDEEEEEEEDPEELVEVDEDVDQEEEEEEEEEEERVEVDMDISNSPIPSPRLNDHQGPGSYTQGKYEAMPPFNAFNIEESRGGFAGPSSETRAINADNFSRVGDGRYSQFSKEMMSFINSEEKNKQVEQNTNDRTRMDSRSAASEIGTKMISPAAETNDPNKPPGIICDFFAKGWCIRGASCRFIHAKDNVKNSHPQIEGDVAAAVSSSREVKAEEALKEIPERSSLPGLHDPSTSTRGNNFSVSSHPFSEKNQISENLGILRRQQLQSVQREESNVGDSTDLQNFAKDDLVFLTSFKDGFKRNQPADDYNNSPIKKGRYTIGNPSSHSGSMEDPTGIRRQRMYGDHTSPLVSQPLNSFSSSLLTTGLFPSSRISAWTGYSLPSNHSSLDANPLDSNRDYRASTRSSAFLKKSSPFSSAERNNFPPAYVSLHSADLKTKISSNDWEPSVPFRPSFTLPPAFLSFSAKQYDPLRDRIELPKRANNSFGKCIEGGTVGNRLHQKMHGESTSGSLRPACDGDTHSMSSHNTYNEKVLDNSCYTGEHNSPGTEAETVGISAVCQNGNLTKKEKPSQSQLKGTKNPNKSSICGDSRHQSDGSSHPRDIKVGSFRDHNEAEVGRLTDEDVQQESKEMRQFRGPLIELVKELLKPKWREGSLSKDAHNLIVKKAVDKIINAFEPHQIPPTLEAVMQYLSACRLKISKLVEAYVEKYGKS